MRFRPALVAMATVVLAPFGLAQGKLWIVGTGVGVLPEVSAALLVASPGDAILVRPGTYNGFSIDRSIAVLGELGPKPTFRGVVTADTGGARSTVILRHLSLSPSSSLDTLTVRDVRGPVWIEDVSAGGGFLGGGQAGLVVGDCDNVTVTRSTLLGGHLNYGVGAEIRNARAHVFGSLLQGASGSEFVSSGQGLFVVGSSGSPSFAYLQKTNVIEGCCSFFTAPALTALSTGGFGYDIWHLDSAFISYLPPPIITQGQGRLQQISADATAFDVRSPVRGGQSTELTFSGVPGTRVFSLLAVAPADPALFLPTLRGPLLVLPILVLDHGVLPTAGSKTVTVGVPPLERRTDFVHVFWQGFSVSPAGEAVLGYPSILTVVNQRF